MTQRLWFWACLVTKQCIRLKYAVVAIGLIYTVAAVYNLPVTSVEIVPTHRTSQLLTNGTEHIGRSNTTGHQLPPHRNRKLIPNLPFTLHSPYLLNSPNVCPTNSNLSYIIIVHSAIKHRENRLLIRKTWANSTLIPIGRIVFLFGLSTNAEDMLALTEEHRVFDDIVQGDFLDSYKNLTHKGVMGFRWVTEFCPNVKAVIKTDDDLVFNAFRFVNEYLPLFGSHSRLMMGHLLQGSKIQRNRGSRWYVPRSEPTMRGKNTYPKYFPGLWVAMGTELVKLMFEKALETPSFWIDDVYLFGVLPEFIKNVTYKNIVRDMAESVQSTIKCYLRTSGICSTIVTKCDMKNQTTYMTAWEHMKKQDMKNSFI